jgi:hypothetical protein
MSLLNWIFDIYQHTQIDKARDEARGVREALHAARTGGSSVDVARLEAQLEELALGVKALQRMLVAKGLCTSEEFAAKLLEIDKEDGVQDGRLRLKK